MNFSQHALDALSRLRTQFLNAQEGLADYWSSEELLALYDATFAERIGWKWNFVLKDLETRNWTLPNGTLVDWGCGTGIASQKILQSNIAPSPRMVSLFDRSTLSVDFASKKLMRLFANISFTQGDSPDASSVLISHVLNELSNAELSRLLERLKRATSIIWVEPSQKQIAMRLVEVREALRNDFHIVAPCVHQASCGMLAPENARHWCHHVALPPQEAFTESKWAKFADAFNIDLSDLSLSYLVLDKRPIKPLATNVKRLVGNVRLYKATASLLLCDEQGVRDVELTKRDLPDVFKAFKKGKIASLAAVEVESGRIKQWDAPI
ncbi:MAG: small ribosomal subunit Rsm22 family protein [Chloroherpetonaceae bacterium]